jgi:glycosyltransferase 2 family protein
VTALRHLRLVLGGAITIALLTWALRGVSFPAVAVAVRSVQAEWLVLGLATFLASFAVRAWRWGTLLSPHGDPGSFGARQSAIFIGFACNGLLPANAGEIARAAVLRHTARVPLGRALGSVVAERLLDAVVVFLLLLAPLITEGPLHALRLGAFPVAWLGVVLAILVIACLVAATWPPVVARLAGWAARAVGLRRFSARIEYATGALLHGLEALRRPKHALVALLMSLLMWGLLAVTYWAGMQSFGITTPGVAGALFVQSTVALAIAIPSAPGYFGPYEAAIRLALGTYGVAGDTIVAYALTMHLLAYVSVLAIGVPLAVRSGLSWRVLRMPPKPARSPEPLRRHAPPPAAAAAGEGNDPRAVGSISATVPLTSQPRVEVRDLVTATRDDRMAAAYLHAALMPASPVVRLGTDFMAEFYYHHLVRDGLIGCRVARVDGHPAGFIAYTARPHDFMLAGLRRHFRALSGVVIGALFERPSRIATVARALGILNLRRDDLAAGPTYDAEILSLGVLPQYRTSEFVRRTGVRLGERLFLDAVSALRASGRDTAAMLSEVRDRATVMFMHAMGFRLVREWLGGVDCFTGLYDMNGRAKSQVETPDPRRRPSVALPG